MLELFSLFYKMGTIVHLAAILMSSFQLVHARVDRYGLELSFFSILD